MSRVKLLTEPEDAPPEIPEPDIQPSLRTIPENQDLEAEVIENLSRIKKFCFIMILTSPIIPIVSYFIDPYHFVFYQSLIIFVMQIYVAYTGYKSTKCDHYSRLEYFRKIVHAFYLYFLISLILNQIAAIFVSSSHNFKNCGPFVNNRVCVNRTGLMTTQLVTLLFSPGLDFSVWIFYKYLLTVLKDCRVGLTMRRV